MAHAKNQTRDHVTEGQRLNFTVTPELAGDRLDVWLQRQMPDHSRVFVQNLIRNGHVRPQSPAATAGALKPNHTILPGEIFEVMVPPAIPSTVEAESIPLKVLHEDSDLIVLNKPPGLVVHPCPGHRNHTLVNALLHHCRGQLSGIGGVERPGIVHRLDRDTSGCIVVAKNDKTHRALQAQFKDRNVIKQYVALVWGIPALSRGRIDAAIGRSATDRKKMRVMSAGGRPAVTDYELIKSYGDISFLRCTLHTGRTHQIRVHLVALGNPILGDSVYGRNRKHPMAQLVDRQMLHAQTLGFLHPRTHKQLEFSAPLPQDMQQLIRALEKRAGTASAAK